VDDIRWEQRFQNHQKALARLAEAVKLAGERELSSLEKQGLIQAFEFVYELSWNTIKDFYEYQGMVSIQGSRDAFRLAFSKGLIENGQIWMDMIESRQLSSHTYNEDTADAIAALIINKYFAEFEALRARLTQELED